MRSKKNMSTYEDYIPIAIRSSKTLVSTGGQLQIAQMYYARAELYDDKKSLFAVMILFPECLISGDGTFARHDYWMVNENKELFIDMLAYFSNSPLGDLVKDMDVIKPLL